MTMNLFSIFDPSNQANFFWFPLVFTPLVLYVMKSKNLSLTMKKYFIMSISKDINDSLSETHKKNLIMIMSLFSMIFIMNFSSLFSFIPTNTAHLSISFSLAISIYLSIMVFSIMNIFKKLMTHLTPMGTPIILMNFMVLIELTSSIIRPITLSIRLSANMIAGHLLMSLLSQVAANQPNLLSHVISPLMMLTILEMAVAFIQAYVFITLTSLYLSEN